MKIVANDANGETNEGFRSVLLDHFTRTTRSKMQVDLSAIPPREAYFYLISSITPRPIAWVSSCSNSGHHNVAPFSFFAGVCADPPTLAFSPVNRPDGSQKDTVVNIRENGQFVVNVVTEDLADQMNVSAAEFDFVENEFEKASIECIDSVNVAPLRVAKSPIHFECRLNQIVDIGSGPLAANLIIGDILLMHIDERVLNEKGRIDPGLVNAIGRLGGIEYCRTTDRFQMKVPAAD